MLVCLFRGGGVHVVHDHSSVLVLLQFREFVSLQSLDSPPYPPFPMMIFLARLSAKHASMIGGKLLIKRIYKTSIPIIISDSHVPSKSTKVAPCFDS